MSNSGITNLSMLWFLMPTVCRFGGGLFRLDKLGLAVTLLLSEIYELCSVIPLVTTLLLSL